MSTQSNNTENLPFFIRPKKAAQLLGIHLSTLYRWHEEGRVPIEKRELGPGTVGYNRDDFLAWMNGDV